MIMIINLISTQKVNLFLDILPDHLVVGFVADKAILHCQCGECEPEEVTTLEIGLLFLKICLSIR